MKSTTSPTPPTLDDAIAHCRGVIARAKARSGYEPGDPDREPGLRDVAGVRVVDLGLVLDALEREHRTRPRGSSSAA